jgi:uncharacterized membrane protein
MAASWETALNRWIKAGLLDASSAQHIRAWEEQHGSKSGPNRLAALAFGFGGLLLMAGAFLFVSAHWDEMGSGARFTLVLSVVLLFHVAAAASAVNSPQMATALHAAGTGALGAGIFLCGQIFNMAEHWPGGVMLWALGAAATLLLLRDWPQALWVAVLVPAWLWGEWVEDIAGVAGIWHNAPPLIGTFLLSLTYLAAQKHDHNHDDNPAWRRALSMLGAIAFIPACILLGSASNWAANGLNQTGEVYSIQSALPWLIALVVPFACAWALCGKQAIFLLLPLLWSLVVVQCNWSANHSDLALYGLYAVAAVAVAAWGVKTQRRASVNLGVLGFALTLIAFYFSNLFDKLGRSLGLIGIGLLFLGGGWALERLRRRLIAHVAGSAK